MHFVQLLSEGGVERALMQRCDASLQLSGKAEAGLVASEEVTSLWVTL